MANTNIFKKLSTVLETGVDTGTIMILDIGKVVDGVVSGDLLDTGFGLIQSGIYGAIKSIENIPIMVAITIKGIKKILIIVAITIIENLPESQHTESILVSNRD